MAGGRAKRLRQSLERSHVSRLEGLKVAIDVQHLWKPPPHDHDHGTIYTLPDGTHRAEADCACGYAQALAHRLRELGAQTLENQPTRSLMIGSYPSRGRAALAWGCHCYLACHLNAGGGNYALLECMSLNPGESLGAFLGGALTHVPGIPRWQAASLSSGVRGAICIETLGQVPAVIVEPFFGDTLTMQPLMLAPALDMVGAALAEGVAAWWERSRPVV